MNQFRELVDMSQYPPSDNEAISIHYRFAPSTSLNNKIQDIPIENPSSHAPLLAIAVKPLSPTLFFDIDVTGFPENDIIIKELNDEPFINFMIPQIIFHDDAVNEIREENSIYDRMHAFFQYKERTWFYAKLKHYHWGIYQTKHGWHMAMEMPTWDRTQFALYELKVIFPKSTYTLDYKSMRLRISPKWDIKTGEEVSKTPELFESCRCYKELRYGTKEGYRTWD